MGSRNGYAPEILVYIVNLSASSASNAAAFIRHVDAELQGETNIGLTPGCQPGSHGVCGGAAVSWC